MKWSWQAGKIAGIPISIHWTFLLPLAWIGVAHYVEGESLASALHEGSPRAAHGNPM